MMKSIRAWAPAALWMGVIFLMSAMPGDLSGGGSGRMTGLIMAALRFVTGGRVEISFDLLHLLLRKLAHMAEYAVLFALDYRALRMTGAWRPGISALILCAAYAVTDEAHQAFVADRGPAAADVMIDTLGAGMMWGLIKVRRAVKKNRTAKKDR